MYPMARVVTSESRNAPIAAPFKRSAESGELILFDTSFRPLKLPFNISATWPTRPFSWLSDDKFVTAVNAFFKVVFAKERAVSVSGMTVDKTGPLAVEKSQDT